MYTRRYEEQAQTEKGKTDSCLHPALFAAHSLQRIPGHPGQAGWLAGHFASLVLGREQRPGVENTAYLASKASGRIQDFPVLWGNSRIKGQCFLMGLLDGTQSLLSPGPQEGATLQGELFLTPGPGRGLPLVPGAQELTFQRVRRERMVGPLLFCTLCLSCPQEGTSWPSMAPITLHCSAEQVRAGGRRSHKQAQKSECVQRALAAGVGRPSQCVMEMQLETDPK